MKNWSQLKAHEIDMSGETELPPPHTTQWGGGTENPTAYPSMWEEGGMTAICGDTEPQSCSPTAGERTCLRED